MQPVTLHARVTGCKPAAQPKSKAMAHDRTGNAYLAARDALHAVMPLAAGAYANSYNADNDDGESHDGAKHEAIAAMLGALAVYFYEALGADGPLTPDAAQRLRSTMFVAYAECDTRR